MKSTKIEPTILYLTDTDARIMHALREKQPQSTEELIKNVGTTKRTFKYRRLPVLKALGIVKAVPGGWAYKNYNPLEETVLRAMEQLLENGFDRFSSATVARVLNKQNPDLRGATPDEVAPIAWRLSSKLDVIMDENAFFHNGHRVIF